MVAGTSKIFQNGAKCLFKLLRYRSARFGATWNYIPTSQYRSHLPLLTLVLRTTVPTAYAQQKSTNTCYLLKHLYRLPLHTHRLSPTYCLQLPETEGTRIDIECQLLIPESPEPPRVCFIKTCSLYMPTKLSRGFHKNQHTAPLQQW